MTFYENIVRRVASSWRIQKYLLYRRIYQYRERTRMWEYLTQGFVIELNL